MSEFKEELKLDVLDENGLTHKDNKFLDVLFGECKGNIKEAMKTAGISGPENILITRLNKQIKELTSEFLTASTAKAAIHLVSVLDKPNLPGAGNVIKTSSAILDRGGVVKKEETVVQEQNFMFILPAKDKEEE
jgi:hypothetical protein